MKAIELLTARGHENIVAQNKSTFEITRENHLTRHGDCILAVALNRGFRDFADEFKSILREEDARLTIIFWVDDEKEVVEASGSPDLTFAHPTDMVIRKSNYTCDRTLAIKASKAAKDFPRQLVAKLKSCQQRVHITLIAERIGKS